MPRNRRSKTRKSSPKTSKTPIPQAEPYWEETSETPSVPANRGGGSLYGLFQFLLKIGTLSVSLVVGYYIGVFVGQKSTETRVHRASEREEALQEHADRYLLASERAQRVASKAQVDKETALARQRQLESRIDALEENLQLQQEAANALNRQLEAAREETKDELRESEAEFKAYRERYKLSVRSQAPGTELGDFAYRTNVFRNAVIKKVSPAGIEITHDAGVARMLFPLLPNYLKVRYAYEPGEGSEFLEQERLNKIKIESIRNQAKIQERAEMVALGERVAKRQADEQAQELLAKIDKAERSIAFCRSKLSSPGRRSVKDYEWQIERLERDLIYYHKQLSGLGAGWTSK